MPAAPMKVKCWSSKERVAVRKRRKSRKTGRARPLAMKAVASPAAARSGPPMDPLDRNRAAIQGYSASGKESGEGREAINRAAPPARASTPTEGLSWLMYRIYWCRGRSDVVSLEESTTMCVALRGARGQLASLCTSGGRKEGSKGGGGVAVWNQTG